MHRISRLTRVAPRQPTLSLATSNAPHQPLPLRRYADTFRPRGASASISPFSLPLRAPVSASRISSSRYSTGAAASVPALDTAIAPAPALDTPIATADATGPLVRKSDDDPRLNEINIQHISKKLHDQIFGVGNSTSPPPELVELAKAHLEEHDLLGKQSPPTDSISFKMPELLGGTLDDHFSKMGQFTADPWLKLAKSFVESPVQADQFAHIPELAACSGKEVRLPETPKVWNVATSGWTKYEGNDFETDVLPPKEELLVFDVEVLYKICPYAVLACAASPTAWYSWISPWALGESTEKNHLIPLGPPDLHRIVVGHNVSYDRARIKEEYNLKQSKTFFIDTMSLHAAVNGMCSRQRPTWMRHRKNRELREKLSEGLDQELHTMVERAADDTETELWVQHSSVNSLRDVAQYHCNLTISKETRDMMSEMTKVEQLKPKLQQCLEYCAADVKVTHEVYKKVLPLFLETCPHPVSFAALRHMGTLLLPVDNSWETYINKSEAIYGELSRQVRDHLISLTERTVSMGFGGEDAKLAAKEGKLEKYNKEVTDAKTAYDKIIAEEKAVLADEKFLLKLKAKALRTAKTALKKGTQGELKGPKAKKAGTTSEKALDKRMLLELEKLVEEEKEIEEQKISQKMQKLEKKLNEEKLKLEIKKAALGETETSVDQSLTQTGAVEGPLVEQQSVEGQLSEEHLVGEQPAKEKSVEEQLAEAVKLIRRRLMTLEEIDTAKGELSKAKPQAERRLAELQDGVLSAQKSFADSQFDGDLFVARINRDPWSDENAWISQLDWSGREVKFKKQKEPSDPLIPVARQKLPGYPNWYRDLFVKASDPMNISVRTRIAPIMLRLQWDGYPLVWTDHYGWTFRVPNEDIDRYSNTPMVRCDNLHEEPNRHVAEDTDAIYFKLPHNGNGTTRCVNPLAKAYQRYFEDGVLTSEFAQAKEALDMNAACSYWISARERIKSQFVVWEHTKDGEETKRDLDMGYAKDSQTEGSRQDLGMILPQIVTMGTITRRAVENTWLTASNAKKNRVGSELKAMIKAPPGYLFVGADVDSEELWIASLIGDAEFKMHGGNAIGFMTLEGSKPAGTDMHSRTAAVLGISRNNAKVFNYGRIYGAGLKFAASLLRQFNPNVNEAEATAIASKLYKVTKGTKTVRKVMREQSFWRGGTESFVFNKLEEFAEQEYPRTPVLGAGITQALQKKHINKGEFLTSRINWAIQSSGVDYLHLLIVSMDYLIQQYKLDARLMITVHDEIRYIVAEADKYKVAMALQIANLWTRCMFAQQMGINDLPQSCAFFSAVDIDHVLRKEVDIDCITPSNPTAIEPGESLGIKELLEKKEVKDLLERNMTPPENIVTKYTYTPRTPVLEELAQESASNIYFMKAQIAKEESDVNKAIREMRANAPNLMRQMPGRSRKHDYIDDWSDYETDNWSHLNTAGRPINHPQPVYQGWTKLIPTKPAPRRPLVLTQATYE
ncbi:mitochondrial DNA polymerase gamma [Drechslerella stenobrocha 248]|uniref:DNA-directed DNA polymerase n=1 Tax=Drechslerella stenobrocha 248 TaxID=1043628 RepID=W7HXC4_9PEZI|nr:mitochondrial DNA polymerase gamma [Drechslerella stenobrocha 248]